MDLGIANKVAVITGGARGIGFADAEALGREGARVALVDRLPEVEDAARALADKGITARAVRLDITDRPAVAEAFAALRADWGPVEILVNNAAIIGTVGQLKSYTDEMWDRDLAVNLTGTFNVTRAAWPQMIEANWGRVVFMASVAGLMGGFGQSSYATTKSGVVGLAKSLALEGARHRITANVVAPGIIGTEEFKKFDPAMVERMIKRVAMRRWGEPAEIANTIAFLCSQPASYLTGQVLPVTGGLDLFTF